jgi:16S rRNA processing protein RimM
MDNPGEALLEIGQLSGTHGLRGDVKIRVPAADPEALLALDRVWLHLPTGHLLALEIVRRVVHKGQLLVRFRGYESLTQVEPLLQSRVLAATEDLPELAADEYYWEQLQGLQVIDRQRGVLGRLEKMFTSAAHDTYVVAGQYGEIMIPAVKEFVLLIDLQEQVVQVDLPQGLIPGELE